jgi:hypothetical protein
LNGRSGVKKKLSYPTLLDNDVREVFPDDASVNEALRVILKAAQRLAVRLPISPKTKRRKHYYEKKTNCRVRAILRGKVLYETPMLTSSPRKRPNIVRNQRKLFEKAHPELKNMKGLTYELQWLEGDDRWVTDKG